MLSTVANAIRAARHALVIARGLVPDEQRECDYCDPTWSRGVSVATVTWTNHLDRPVRRGFCPLCVSEALLQASSDGYDVTVCGPFPPVRRRQVCRIGGAA